MKKGLIIAVANQKGGVGKSTTAHAIGSGLMINGEKVLFVDLDSQCNLTFTLNADMDGITSYSLLNGDATATEAIQHIGEIDIIAANPLLAGTDRKLTGKETDLILQKALSPLKSVYDYIIIDTPPALSILTINALTASNLVIIPAQADIYSLQGIGQLYNTITAVQQHTNPDLRIAGILLTRYNGRTVLSRDLQKLIKNTAENLHTKLYSTFIRESISIKEAQASNKSIFEYARRSNSAKDYNAFINELLKDIKKYRKD